MQPSMASEVLEAMVVVAVAVVATVPAQKIDMPRKVLEALEVWAQMAEADIKAV